MRRVLIAVAALVLCAVVAVVYVPRYLAQQEQAHVCQVAKDTVRAASPNPSETTFASCGSESMVVIYNAADTYEVMGTAQIADQDGNTSGHFYMVSIWRTADGWESKLNYLRD